MPLDCPLTPPEYAAAAAAFAGADPVQVRGWQARLGVDADGLAGAASLLALRENRPDGAAPAHAYNGNTQGRAVTYSLRHHGADFALSPHFTLVEFASRCGTDEVKAHPALIALLGEVREHFDAPVTVNSGYRSAAHNRRIGGASRSRHVMGLAADIVVGRGQVRPREVADFLAERDPGGLAEYPSFTHVDVQGKGRRWKINPRR